MPPFGNLYHMDVFVVPELAENDYIAFNAGSHTELIRMRYADFAEHVQPKVIEFAGVR
jgi:Ala-tRNA(Pro) deacylase